jgi:DNA-binding MarR family transcriptional regulator
MRKSNIFPDEIKEYYRLSVLIKQTDNAITKARENELRKYGITPEQAAALICIRSLGNRATSAEISRWLFRDESSMLVLIRRMIKLGLIRKASVPNNKHLIRLSLTPKGLTAYQNAVEFVPLKNIFHSLTPKKQQQLWSLLETLRSGAFGELHLDTEIYSGLFSPDLVLEKDKAEILKPV